MDKLDRILDKIDKVQEDVSEIKVEQATQGKDIAKNTVDLTDHKEGVRQNRARVRALEKNAAPMTVAQLLKRVVLIAGGVATVAGSVYTLIKLYDL